AAVACVAVIVVTLTVPLVAPAGANTLSSSVTQAPAASAEPYVAPLAIGVSVPTSMTPFPFTSTHSALVKPAVLFENVNVIEPAASVVLPLLPTVCAYTWLQIGRASC